MWPGGHGVARVTCGSSEPREKAPVSSESSRDPADSVLSPLELTLLQRHPDARPRPNATIRDAMLAIAALGGHIKNNGDPGWQVLGRGYEDLLILEQGAALALGCDQS